MDEVTGRKRERNQGTLQMHYWKGGAYKQILQLILYRSIIVPLIMAAMAYLALPPFAEGIDKLRLMPLHILRDILIAEWKREGK